MYNNVNATPSTILPDRFSLKGLDISTLPLLSFEDKRLVTPPPLFDFERDGEYAEMLVTGMYERMLHFGGAGLSANQIGIPHRVFVFGNEEHRHHIINPTIIGVSKEQVAMQEGCLSLPGFFLTLQRPKEVTASYQNINGETVVSSFTGIGARVFLHEYDHMEGILFTQHASPFKLKWELDKIKKRIRRFEKNKRRGVK